MKEKEVLPEGTFLQWYSYHPDGCSADFIEGLSLGMVPHLACSVCHRVHFDGSSTSSLSRRRLCDLRTKKAKDPQRYVEHSGLFPWLELRTFFREGCPQRAKTVFDCPCGLARYYEMDIWKRCPVETARCPNANVTWNLDGQRIAATVEVRLPDNHMVFREYSARLVSVECLWGSQPYRKYYLTDFSPPYKKLDIVEVGLDPEKATLHFREKYLDKAGWDFAARLHILYSHLRLYTDWGRRSVSVRDIVLPPHGIVNSHTQTGPLSQEEILERVRVQQIPKPAALRVPLSGEELANARRNSEFNADVTELVEALTLNNVL